MGSSFFRTCVSPEGTFCYGLHRPRFTACNMREHDHIVDIGQTSEKVRMTNAVNFPQDDVEARSDRWIFEIPNAFPFMGATFIPKAEADSKVDRCNPFTKKTTHIAEAPEDMVDRSKENPGYQPVLLALARTSSDPTFLALLAEKSCRFTHDKKTGQPSGMLYERTESGCLRPAISDWHLFELVSNNPWLPDAYKQTMVLTPGAQGGSPVVGEYKGPGTHVWEYLRDNSYIPWGHYAANMAHDAVRYKIGSLSLPDIVGLRHLYYQRTYVQLATAMGLSVPSKRRTLTEDELEDCRQAILVKTQELNRDNTPLPFTGTIWGQNFGFDLSPSGYRLNASHQQIHQQYAFLSSHVPVFTSDFNAPPTSEMMSFCQGDLVAEWVQQYQQKTGQPFFEMYLKAIRNNKRLDALTGKNHSLIYFEDKNVIAFVPKAQRSQGEVQVMTKANIGNIIEAESGVRHSLDRGILLTMKVLENLGVEMMTVFELAKRFDDVNRDQRLLYCFIPRHPESPGSFTEIQQRWVVGHYPEDFAETCRKKAEEIRETALGNQ